MREKKGFTLVELIVAIAIIGLLSALLLPALHRSRDEARKAEAINELHALDSGIRMYEMDFGEYPSSGNADLMASLRADSYVNKIDEGDLRNGEMLDPWKNPYVYLNPGIINPESYDLFCKREDGTMILAGAGGMRIGPVAVLLEEAGVSIPSLHTSSVSDGQSEQGQPAEYIADYVADTITLLGTTDYGWIAEQVGRNGFNSSITLSFSAGGSTSGSASGNTITITVGGTVITDTIVRKAAAVLAHEGFHVINYNLGTAYNYQYSVDEEWQADLAMLAVWREVKKTSTDTTLDWYQTVANRGEDYFKDILQNYGSYANLPEYPGWEQKSW